MDKLEKAEQKMKENQEKYDVEKKDILADMQAEIEALKNAEKERTQTIMFKAEEEKRILQFSLSRRETEVLEQNNMINQLKNNSSVRLHTELGFSTSPMIGQQRRES